MFDSDITVIVLAAVAGCWITWFGTYFRLVWRFHDSTRARLVRCLFPIALFVESAWPAAAEPARLKSQALLLVPAIVTGLAD